MALFVEYKDSDRMAESLAAIVAGQLDTAIRETRHATLVVPGGSTPGAFLTALSGALIPWDKIIVLPSDERVVPLESPRSNAGMIGKALDTGPARAARRLLLSDGSPLTAEGLAATNNALRAAMPIAVCVLGMGADMHTASLFPGAEGLAPALDPNSADLILPIQPPNAPDSRVTLTAAALLSARHLHVLITGRDKLDAFHAAETPGPAERAPIRAILNAPQGATIHYCEKASKP